MTTAILFDRTGKELVREELKRQARMSMQAVSDQRRLDALKKLHPEAFAAQIKMGSGVLHFFFDKDGRSQHTFADPFAKPEPAPKGKFTETKPGIYRTRQKAPKRLEVFPFIPGRPEWSQVPWVAAKRESADHGTMIGACDWEGARQFYFQQWGNPEVVVVVRAI